MINRDRKGKTMSARQYQIDATNEIVSRLSNGEQRILLSMPIGSGKTRVAAMTMKNIKRKVFLFVVNREALLSQSYIEFSSIGLKCAVVHNTITKDINGNLLNKDLKKVNVVITLIGSSENIPKTFKPHFIILDEAHKSTSSEFQKMVNKYNVPVIGLTATPGRPKNDEGEHIREWYGSKMINPITFREMIDNGYCAKPEYFQFSNDDHLIRTWKKLTSKSENKRTIVFSEDTKHSLEIVDAYRNEGISCELITSGNEDIGISNQNTNQRNEIFRNFRDGKIQVLVTVYALCEGFDEPLAKYCLIARSISSNNVPLFHQIVGRVTRLGTDGCVIADFGGNIEKFGPIEDYDWNEYESEVNSLFVKKDNVISVEKFERAKKIFLRCDGCNHVYDMKAHATCSHCNAPNSIKMKAEVTELKDTMMKMISKKVRDDLIRNYKTDAKAFRFIAETAQKAMKMKKWEMFNRMYANVFDNQGEIKYPWLLMINSNTKMEDVISWKN
jgi:superfamily II DNA or RNA helicase